MNGDLRAALGPLIDELYPTRPDTLDALMALAQGYQQRLAHRGDPRPSAATTYLIAYANSITSPGQAPLRTLRRTMHEMVGDVVSDLHLLPFYPWTSDDGFAVVDHREVDPAVGTWEDVAALADEYRLMFDFVANHVSSTSHWFTRWLAGDPELAGYFIERDPAFDTSHVVRPRTDPLFHAYPRPAGSSAWVWTTFGPDQVDINVTNPAVLLDLTDVLLGYVARGATTVRLDAIGFLWKRTGTPCLHLPETHAVIRLWRTLLDHLAPGVRLLTETNVPHEDNISYFGNGNDEAHMVYQFALPPLVLHAFIRGSSRVLSEWAARIGPVSDTATWFNFLASHDGIGMRPAEGLLDESERQLLVERTLARGGRVSMASRPDGSQAVYELNINYLDALASPAEAADEALVAAKGLAAHSILLAMVGVPAIYYHSLFGSRSDIDAVQASGIPRRINRQTLDADALAAELCDHPRRSAMFHGLRHMLAVRAAQDAFSPFGGQQIETVDDRLLAIRRAPGTAHELLCVTNLTGQPVTAAGLGGHDILADQTFDGVLPGYGYVWLRP